MPRAGAVFLIYQDELCRDLHEIAIFLIAARAMLRWAEG
jgi:hypothetical protein